MAKSTKLSITLHPDTHAKIEAKQDSFDGNFSGTVEKLLSRYLDLLQREQVELNRMFAPNEKGLIVDALNGTGFLYPFSVQMVCAAIEDALSMDGLGKKWEIEEDVFLSKINTLSNGQKHALVDAVQAWWGAVGNGKEVQPEQLFNLPKSEVKND